MAQEGMAYAAAHLPFNHFRLLVLPVHGNWPASHYGVIIADDPVGGADHSAAATVVENLAHAAGTAPTEPALRTAPP